MKSSPTRHRSVLILALVSAAVGALALPATAQFPGGPPQNLPPLAERRAAVLKEFDADGDGLLSAVEREAARKGWAQRMLSRREDRGFFRPPPELLEEFDTNKDGELDDEEGQLLGQTMGRRFEALNRDYDLNGNGRLDEDEIAAAMKAIDDGTLKGIPKMFLQMARGGPGGRRPGTGGGPQGGGRPGEDLELPPGELIRAADKDGDGRLSGSELETARAALMARRAGKLKAQEGK